jgi:hypothetical protein
MEWRPVQLGVLAVEIQQMLWEEGNSLIDIINEAGLLGGIDELVAAHADIHLEQIQLDDWSMRIDAGGKSFKLDFQIKEGHITVSLLNIVNGYMIVADAALTTARWFAKCRDGSALCDLHEPPQKEGSRFASVRITQ